MPLRYHKEIKLGDFVKLNLNKKSMSVSVGVPGFHFNIGPQGPMINVDLPGGMSYRKYFGGSGDDKKDDEKKADDKKEAKAEQDKQEARAEKTAEKDKTPEQELEELAGEGSADKPERAPRRGSRPKRVEPQPRADTDQPAAAVPPEEEPFQLAFLAYQRGDFVNAYRRFGDLIDTPYQADALLMAGITSSYLERDDEAVTYLGTLLDEGKAPLPGDPESLVTRYLPGETVNIQITDFTAVDLPLDTLSALLLSVELLQGDGQLAGAVSLLEEVFVQNPGLRIVQLSLADLYIAQGRLDQLYQLFMQHTPELSAEDDVSVEILYTWAQALTLQGMFDAADKVYKRALTRRKGINTDLRLLVAYGCADLYERWGKTAQARKGFEHIFAENPQFFDVRERIAALVEPEEPVSVAK